jgi:hypothetical protein
MYIALYGFSTKQMIQLQGVNKLFYTRVAQWMRVVIIFPTIRLSEPALINTEITENFVFPSAAMMREWRGVLPTLIGFENNEKDGKGNSFNFILSNGTRSTQRDKKYPTKYTHMMPADAHNKIRSVTIKYNNHCIWGFSFFDKYGALLWYHGFTTESYWCNKETVLLAENEVIVGVVAKLYPGCLTAYSDFQFQIASK